jgi:DNA-binding winged helix-turn-helix (wHTH) protein
MSGPVLIFPPFCLDPLNACLWRGTRRLALMPKDFAVLHYLATHADRLVTQEELLKAVWSDAVVSPGVLKLGLHRIRRVLGDKVAKPRFIETVHRRGYWFIAPVTTNSQPVQSLKSKVQGLHSAIRIPQSI